MSGQDKTTYPDLSAEMEGSQPGLDATSPTDSVIAGDFGSLSPEEQERQREEWKEELRKTEEEIMTLKQVLHSKEQHALGLKRRLGITAWREFSEDMSQGLKNIQESVAYKKTAEGLNQASKKTSELWSSVTHSQGFQTVSDKVGSVFGAAKSKISGSLSTQNISAEAKAPATDSTSTKPAAAASGTGDSGNGSTAEEKKN